MKQVIELYDKHCYNNDYGGIEFNRKHGYKFIEAIEALRTALSQQPATPEPDLLLDALQAAKATLVAFKFIRGDANRWEPHDEDHLAKVDVAIYAMLAAKDSK